MSKKNWWVCPNPSCMSANDSHRCDKCHLPKPSNVIKMDKDVAEGYSIKLRRGLPGVALWQLLENGKPGSFPSYK